MLGQRHQRQTAALALVVGTHQEDDVFDRHHEDQRPEHQRDRSQHRQFGLAARTAVTESFTHGVERAGADVAEHHTDGPDDQTQLALGRQSVTAVPVSGRGRIGCSLRRCGAGRVTRGRCVGPGGIPGHAWSPGAVGGRTLP